MKSNPNFSSWRQQWAISDFDYAFFWNSNILPSCVREEQMRWMIPQTSEIERICLMTKNYIYVRKFLRHYIFYRIFPLSNNSTAVFPVRLSIHIFLQIMSWVDMPMRFACCSAWQQGDADPGTLKFEHIIYCSKAPTGVGQLPTTLCFSYHITLLLRLYWLRKILSLYLFETDKSYFLSAVLVPFRRADVEESNLKKFFLTCRKRHINQKTVDLF